MRKKVWLGVGIIAVMVALAGVVVLLGGHWRSSGQDLRDALASALNTDANYLVLNLPPNPGRYPGAVLRAAGSLRPVLPGKSEDPALTRGEYVTIGWSGKQSSRSSGELVTGSLRELVHSAAASDYDLTLDSVRTIEMAEPELQRRIAQLPEATDKPNLVAITRSYEATATVRLHRNRDVSGEAWQTLQRQAHAVADGGAPGVGLSLEQAGDDALTIKTPPIIIAFETAKVSFTLKSLGTHPEIELEKLTRQQFDALAANTAQP